MTRSNEHDERIGAMFDAIAHRYDLLNHVLSFGQDVRWRRRAVALARAGRGDRALDVGAGTGDLALALSRSGVPVIAVDLAAQMLLRARRRPGGGALRLVVGSATALPFADAAFDAVVAGFAVRNFGDLAAGAREMRRVVRPGGRAVIVELALPPNRVLRRLHLFYLHRVAPLVARALGSRFEAYRYLPVSVEAFPDPDRFAAILANAGFSRVRFERLTFGVATVHVADA